MRFNRKAIVLSIVLASLLLFSFFLCRHYRPEVKPNNEAFLHTLNSFRDFERFAGTPLDDAYPTITTVKVVYDLRGKQMYYINSHLFRLHYDFCSKVLGYKLGLRLFNMANYGDQREFYLANINYLKGNRRFVLEFGPSDEIDSLQIIEMYSLVSRSAFFKDSLLLLLNNTNTLRYFGRDAAIPTCDINTLSNGIKYQSIQTGTCTGRLIICRDVKKQFLSILPNDVIVVKGTPTEIPLCKAIISDCFQTPLSHIQVLSHNKKTPSAYLATVFENDSVLKYEGKQVKLVVTEDTIVVTAASSEAISDQPAKTITLPLNTTVKTIVGIEDCKKLGNADIGAKARGFTDLKTISDDNKNLFVIPEGAFVIPFFFYQQHLEQAGVNPLLSSLSQCKIYDTRKMDSLLSCIRKAINATPVSPQLLKAVSEKIVTNKAGNSYRFRSSSNAEDLLNFSGAGLYESKTAKVRDPKKTVERAIRKVWASMYNYRAYQERRFSGIEEKTVAMSILVHRSFPDEDINGVIITMNIYRDDYPGIVINAQKGDVSTVDPPDSVTCEQLILTENRLMNPFSKKISARYITYSSLNPEGPLLSYDQLVLLKKSTDAIVSFYKSKNNAWDIEFKFDAGKLYIKQARPYR